MSRHRPRRAAVAAAAALLAGAALGGCTGGTGAVSTGSGNERFLYGDGVATLVPASARKAAPALSGTDLDGGPLSVAAGEGPLVLNVWGSWCAPCKAEQPGLERVARATRSRGVRFVGINVREPGRTPPRRHVERFGVTYPSFYDPSSRLVTRFAVPARTIPTTYVVDAEGRIAAYVYGGIDEAGLTELLDRVVGAA